MSSKTTFWWILNDSLPNAVLKCNLICVCVNYISVMCVCVCVGPAEAHCRAEAASGSLFQTSGRRRHRAHPNRRSHER